MGKRPNFRATETGQIRRRMAIYARVSTQEQTKGDYPSCESQIEELEAYCLAKGWEVYAVIKDEGKSAGSLKRPGLTDMRHMVQNNEIDGVLCTWYDRLTRSREFYVLDEEFRTHKVEFITIHDPTDRDTASGRFMEMMLVGAKAYEREQTGEKVSTKMQMRAEKGMWNGGHIPFGFHLDSNAKILCPDPAMTGILHSIFRTFVETGSDHRVRDWLTAQQIPSPGGKAHWSLGTIYDILGNRRYIGEIEINKGNRGKEGLPAGKAYRVVKAPHDPLISIELFELAQSMRQEKALRSPNRCGRPHSYSRNQCGRIYTLQGRLICGICGASMTPYYVVHKPGKARKSFSYIHYYTCSQQLMRGRGKRDHRNQVLARISEDWIRDIIKDLVTSDEIIEQAVRIAQSKRASQLQPQQEALKLTQKALLTNAEQIEKLVATIAGGQVTQALQLFLNERADRLKLEREQLRLEQHRLMEELKAADQSIDAASLRTNLADFVRLQEVATREELQRLVRLFIRRIEWLPDGSRWVEFYPLPTSRRGTQVLRLDDWLVENVRFGCPRLGSLEPVFLLSGGPPEKVGNLY